MARDVEMWGVGRGLFTRVDDDVAELLEHRCEGRVYYNPKEGYASVFRVVNGIKERRQLHRVVMEAAPGTIVDHINGNKLDNRRENLRFCSKTQNAWNSTRVRRTNRLGLFRGVTLTWRPFLRYRVRIGVGGRDICGGIFKTLDEAIARRIEMERQYCGEFAPVRTA